MGLVDRISSDLVTAMKARDADTVATLRMAVAAIRNLRVAAGHSGEVTDAEALDLLTREARKRGEAAEAFAGAGRTDLAEKERRELAVLQRYLPEQLDADALRGLVDEAVAETGATSPSDLGRVMGQLSPQTKGRADGRLVSEVVRRLLAG